MSCTVIFDGVRLDDYCAIAEYKFSALPVIEPVTQQVPGRDGEAFLGSCLEPLEIAVRLRLDAGSIDPVTIRAKWAEVAPLLRKDGLRKLSFGGERYYLAMVAGATEMEQHGYVGEVTVTFRCPDPVAYGAERSVVVPSGGSASFVVGGSYPALPVIEADAVRSPSSLVWGVRLDGGDFLHVATGSASARAVRVDCAERECRLAGAVALPTLDSDWLSLEPGNHTMRMDNGTGAAVVTYRERWL